MLRRPIRCLAPICCNRSATVIRSDARTHGSNLSRVPLVSGEWEGTSFRRARKALLLGWFPKASAAFSRPPCARYPGRKSSQLKSIQMLHWLARPFQLHHHHQNRNRAERHRPGTGNRHHPILHRVNFLFFPSPTGPPSPVPQTRIVSASRTCSDVPGLELLRRDRCAARGRHNDCLFETRRG